MNKSNLQFIIVFIIFIDFIIVCISGFFHLGVRGLHQLSAILLIIFMIIHLLLNFSWIKAMLGNLFKRNNHNKKGEKEK